MWLTWVLVPSSFDSKLQCIWTTYKRNNVLLWEFSCHNTRLIQGKSSKWCQSLLSNLPAFCLLGLRSRRLHRLNLLLRQWQSSRDGVRPGRGKVHQGINPIPARKELRFYLIIFHKISSNLVLLTWHPPETCQALRGTHGNICRTEGNINKQWASAVCCILKAVCATLLELNSLSVSVFNLSHDSVGIERLGFFFHTIFWK